MADYYTKFSFIVPFEGDEAHVQRVADELADLIKDAIESGGNETFPEYDAPMYGVDIEAQGSDVWIHDDAGEGSVNGAIAAAQWLLQQPGVATDKIEFEWSNDCSKPRTDAYGGGIAEITPDSLRTWGTWQGVPPPPNMELLGSAKKYLDRYETWCLADSPDEDDETELRTDAVAIIAAFVERGMSELP